MWYSLEEIKKKVDKEAYEILSDALNGSDYEQGQLEDIEGTGRKTKEAIAGLLLVLLKKEVLTKEEVVNILYETQ